MSVPIGIRLAAAALAAASLVAALPVIAAVPGQADAADRERPVQIESDRMTADDAKKTAVFEGHVVLTQGTLVIHADRLTLRQDKDGFQYGTALGDPATFRQKREGANEYIDGEAQRIEYDGRTERVQFFERAHLRRDAGDDVRGNYISYDSRTQFFTVESTRDAGAQGGDARVHVTIMPKKKEAESKPVGAAGAPKPAPGATPRP